jgi:hypothetical protein
MIGFAELVLQKIKASDNYDEYLGFVIGWENYNSITREAQGSILEDAISYLLKKKTHPIKFALAKFSLSCSGKWASTKSLRFVSVNKELFRDSLLFQHWTTYAVVGNQIKLNGTLEYHLHQGSLVLILH